MKTVRQMLQRSAYVGVSLVAMGCTSTVTLPASQIPELSEGLYAPSTQWPTVRTVEGTSKTIASTEGGIQIQMGSQVDTFDAPYAARIADGNLEVATTVAGKTRRQEYPLANKPIGIVKINRKRKILGGVLVGVGAPMVLAGALVAIADKSKLGRAFSLTSAGPGLALTVQGLFLMSTDPRKPSQVEEPGRALTFEVGSSGANLTVAF